MNTEDAADEVAGPETFETVGEGIFRVIAADPPWAYNKYGQGNNGAARNHYATVPYDRLGKMPVHNLAHPEGCALFMWATGPKLPDAIILMRAWGFSFKTVAFVWRKTNQDGTPWMGLGSYTRSDAEFVLLGVLGGGLTKLRKSAAILETFDAPVGEHSEKPEIMQDRVEALLPGPYVELFARRRRPGWEAWGDQVVSSSDVAEALRIKSPWEVKAS